MLTTENKENLLKERAIIIEDKNLLINDSSIQYRYQLKGIYSKYKDILLSYINNRISEIDNELGI